MAATASLPRFGGLAMMRPHENPAPRFRRPMAKRVTWASSDHLCQVRMFLAEDAPFRAGLPQGQEELQGKTPRFLQRSDDLPPGFGGGVVSCLKNDSKNDAELVAASVVAAIPWKSPQKIELDPSWNVEAGGGSSEIEVQKQRESKTLEAVYPRSSAIPSSPLEAPIESHPTPDDRSIFVIPVSSPDDDSDDGESEISRNKSVISSSKNSASTGEQSYCGGGAATANSVAAAAAAAAAALSQAAVASAIDPNLLLQLLANPSLVETLSGVRNNSLVNTSNGNGSVPPNQVVAGVKNLTSNSTVSTATTSAAISSSPRSQNVSSSMGFTDAGYTPSHRFVAPPPSSSSSSASIPGSGSGSGSGPASAASSAPSPWVSPYQVQTQASVSTSDGGAGIYGGYKNPSTMMRHQHQQQQQQQQQFMLPNSQQQQQQQNSARPSELSYFKELIMQHGGKGGGGGQGGYYSNGSVSGMNQSTMTGSSTSAGGGGQVGHATGTGMGTGGFRRSNRTCAYFNTPKGCRNGPKCPFVHDSKRSGSELTLFQHQQQAKRMRG